MEEDDHLLCLPAQGYHKVNLSLNLYCCPLIDSYECALFYIWWLKNAEKKMVSIEILIEWINLTF